MDRPEPAGAAGPCGGYAVGDVLAAMEQKRPLFLTHHRVRAKGERPTRAQHAIAHALEDAEKAMRQQLAATTIADILAQFGSKLT